MVIGQVEVPESFDLRVARISRRGTSVHRSERCRSVASTPSCSIRSMDVCEHAEQIAGVVSGSTIGPHLSTSAESFAMCADASMTVTISVAA
ncbi:MAG: hypothetical protein ABJA87_04825 [bacterium]